MRGSVSTRDGDDDVDDEEGEDARPPYEKRPGIRRRARDPRSEDPGGVRQRPTLRTYRTSTRADPTAPPRPKANPQLPPTPTHPAPPRPQIAAQPKGSQHFPQAGRETPTPPLAPRARARLPIPRDPNPRASPWARTQRRRRAKEGTARAKHRSPWDPTPRRTSTHAHAHARTYARTHGTWPDGAML